MNITITTDASFSKKYQKGTFAFYITSNAGSFSMSGELKKTCHCPSEAEIKCIVNSLAFVSQNAELFKKCKFIYVNTDSMNAIHVWEEDKPKIKKYRLKHLMQQFGKSIDKTKKLFDGKRIELRHVKAHTETDDKRSYVNDLCDKAAKAEMKLLIDKLEKK